MRFSRAAIDLRFVIGSFLGVIGLIVLIQYLIHPDEVSQEIHVNLLGGSLLFLTGISLALSVFLGKDEAQ